MKEIKLDNQPLLRAHRLHAICPYYAMFPPQFARDSISAFTKPGELVFDPFCGRGTTLLEALLLDRDAIGIDINPVAAVISSAKVQVPQLGRILRRIDQLEADYRVAYMRTLDAESKHLPVFFSYAYSKNTLWQILFLRDKLNWASSKVDQFICALVLGHLHGESEKSPSYFSNQMPHTIATKPDYSVKYWKKNGQKAPERNVFEILRTKAHFRLEEGIPRRTGKVALADVRYAEKRLKSYTGQVAAVITSPPYLDVTNFEEDQWLRLWFLGGEPYPTYSKISNDDRHSNIDRYFGFLTEAWAAIQPLLRPSAVLICRIGTMHMSYLEMKQRLMDTVSTVWANARLIGEPTISTIRNSQTAIIQPDATGCREEYDFRFELRI